MQSDANSILVSELPAKANKPAQGGRYTLSIFYWVTMLAPLSGDLIKDPSSIQYLDSNNGVSMHNAHKTRVGPGAFGTVQHAFQRRRAEQNGAVASVYQSKPNSKFQILRLSK
jgi:hypothetical protein